MLRRIIVLSLVVGLGAMTADASDRDSARASKKASRTVKGDSGGTARLVGGTATIEIAAAASANPFNPCGVYDAGEVVPVDIYVNQSSGAEHLVRLIKFHLDNTSAGLMPLTGFQWEFGAAGHYIDDSNASGPAGLAIAYADALAADLGPQPANQLALPNAASVLVATATVTMPGAVGLYTLDLMNAGGATPDDRAALSYGFGCKAASSCDNGNHADATFPITFSRAAGDLTGGTFQFNVIDQALAVATPNDGGVLPHTAKNFVLLDFDFAGDINAPLAPGAGCDTLGLTISELQAGGVLVPLNAANFNCQRVGDGSVLRVIDNAGNLLNETWVRLNDLAGTVLAGNPWEVDLRVVFGDVNSSGSTDVTDVSSVLANRGLTGDSRFDINGSGSVDVTDVSTTLANRGSTLGASTKPDGHDCLP